MPRHRLAVSCLVFATAIFRAELALLLAAQGLWLAMPDPPGAVRRLAVPVLVSFFVSLAISIPIDSYFWQRLIWPELSAFFFNAVQGSSADWGTEPWHFYFTSALPRVLLNPLTYALLIPLALIQPATRRPALAMIIPNLLFAATYSILPHKEARFVFYVAPSLTAAAALGANYLWTRRAKSYAHLALAGAAALSVPLSLAASTAFLVLSSLNYPGGEALTYLRANLASSSSLSAGGVVPVHASVLACMTGVTLFGSSPAAWPTHHASGSADDGSATLNTLSSPGGVSIALDKTESAAELRDPRFWSRFDYAIVETEDEVRGPREAWEILAVVEGYDGIDVLRPGQGSSSGGDGAAETVGRGLAVRRIRERVRRLTGGWWIGPRMVPRLKIMQRMRKESAEGKVAAAR
jgi:alpha-1,6-mannosyltransferase